MHAGVCVHACSAGDEISEIVLSAWSVPYIRLSLYVYLPIYRSVNP